MTLKPTSPQEWREVTTRVVQLPSGAVVRLRPVTAYSFVRSGISTSFLQRVAQESVSSRSILEKPANELTEDEQKALLRFTDDICRLMFVEPRIVDDPNDPNGITIDLVPQSDMDYIFTLFGRPLDELQSFRLEQVDDVVGMDAAQGNEDPAQ